MMHKFREIGQTSFYMYIFSNSSVNYFENNQPNEFTFSPVKTFNPSDFVLGLSEIIYGDTFELPTPTPVSNTPSENNIKYFGHTLGDNILSAYAKRSNTAYISKGYLNFQQFLLALSLQLKNEIPVVEFLYDYEGEEVGRSNLTFNDPVDEGYKLEISPELATILGFTTNIFNPGEYTATNLQDVESFGKLEYSQRLYVKMYKVVEYDLPVKEPEDKDLESLLDSCQIALSTLLFEVRFPVDADGKILYIEIDTKDLYIKLPPAVNKLIGLQPTKIIS
jgi:hypothetical protein